MAKPVSYFDELILAAVLVGCTKGKRRNVARGLWFQAVKMVRFLEATAGTWGKFDELMERLNLS